MSATLEHVQPNEITEAFLTPIQILADRQEDQTYGNYYQAVTGSAKIALEMLSDWMDKEGYVFARKVEGAS